jgi:hypothetical protein
MKVGEVYLETTAAFQLRIAGDRLSFAWQGRDFELGNAHLTDPVSYLVTPDAGDEATLEVMHSALSWPTPLDLNFMTGVSPSWKRHRYYRLVWKKRDGETLRALWRYEQWRYPGGWSGDMNSLNPTGLIRLEIASR